MISRIGEPKQDRMTSGTFDSVTINAYLFAAAANTAIAAANFKPEQVQVKVILKRNGATHTIMNDNLLVLGMFNSLKNGLHQYITGYDLLYPAAGVKANKLRTVTLKFGGNVRVNPGDELIVEISPGIGCFTAALDTAVSYLEFYFNPSIGYEIGLYTTKSDVVQANTTNQAFSPGNNVTKIALLNFDKDNYSENVIETVTLSSDKLDMNLTFNKLLAREATVYPDHQPMRFGAAPPTQSVFRFANQYPQSFMLFDGDADQSDLSSTRLDVTYKGENVSVSQNYVVVQSFIATQQQIKEAIQRQNKHMGENIAALPKA